jgi:hypothetical protein
MHEPDPEDWAIGERAVPVAKALADFARRDMGTDNGAMTALIGAAVVTLKRAHPDWTDGKMGECVSELVRVFLEHA